MRGRVEFTDDRCKGCGICVGVCPRQIISLAERRNALGHRVAAVEDMASCTGCAICAEMCPDCVIEVYRERAASGADTAAAALAGDGGCGC